MTVCIGVNSWVGSRDPQILKWRAVGGLGPPWNIIPSNVQVYEMWAIFKAGTFQKYNNLCIIKIKIPGMIPSIAWYVLPSVKILGPTTPGLQTRVHDPQILNLDSRPQGFKQDWSWPFCDGTRWYGVPAPFFQSKEQKLFVMYIFNE